LRTFIQPLSFTPVGLLALVLALFVPAAMAQRNSSGGQAMYSSGRGVPKNDAEAEAMSKFKKAYPSAATMGTGFPAFGADALRFTFASLAGFARTLNFDLGRCEGYRNFCNKLWNATRFVLMNTEGKDCGQNDKDPVTLSFIDRWIISQLQRTEAEAAQGLDEYRFDNAAGAIYRFVWDEYCDWYVELAKLQLQSPDEAVQRGTRRTLVRTLETALRLAHPIIPFITEELWQKVAPLAGKKGETIMLQPYPKSQPEKIDVAAEREMELLKEWTTKARNLRSEAKIPPRERVPAYSTAMPGVSAAGPETINTGNLVEAIIALARLSSFERRDPLPDSNAPVAFVGNARMMLFKTVDPAAERTRLAKEVARLETEIAKVSWKRADRRDADKIYNPMSFTDLKKMAPALRTHQCPYLADACPRSSAPTGRKRPA